MANSLLKKAALSTAIASLAVPLTFIAPAKAGVEQEIVNNVIQNILQNVRDQIQRRRIAAPPGRFQFTAEESDFDKRNPFATNDPSNPFAALAYAKAPAMAPAPVVTWIYGINGIGSADRTYTVSTDIHSATGTGAFDATKIGIFTATDALTFVATGSGTWSHILGSLGSVTMDTSTGTGSGTLAYLNGAFSTDFTVAASWTHIDWVALGFPPQADSSALSYTWNAQYKFDFAYGVWFEPTAGVTYTEAYSKNFGVKTGDATEIHAGARVGTEMKWMGYTVQPSLSGAVFKIVDQNGVGAGGAGLPPGLVVPGGGAGAAFGDTGLGGRGAGKINVIWTPNFSSFVEAHGSGVAGTKGNSAIAGNFVATQSYGGMGGLRYTW